MRRHAPTYPVLPALLLVALLAVLSLFAVPTVGATAGEIVTSAGAQATAPEAAAAGLRASVPPTVHDNATVQQGSAPSAHPSRLPLVFDTGDDRPHLSPPGAAGAVTTAGDDPGRRTAAFIQGRAPPAAAR